MLSVMVMRLDSVLLLCLTSATICLARRVVYLCPLRHSLDSSSWPSPPLEPILSAVRCRVGAVRVIQFKVCTHCCPFITAQLDCAPQECSLLCCVSAPHSVPFCVALITGQYRANVIINIWQVSVTASE